MKANAFWNVRLNHKMIWFFLLVFLSPITYPLMTVGGFSFFPLYVVVLICIYIALSKSSRLNLGKIQTPFLLYNFWVILFVMVGLMTDVSFHEVVGIGAITFMTIGISIYLMQNFRLSISAAEQMVEIMGAFCVLLSLASILEFITNIHFHDGFYLKYMLGGYHYHYTSLTYGNSNGLGQILVVLFPFVLYSPSCKISKLRVFGIGLVEVAIVLSASRLSLIVLFLLIIICCFFSSNKSLKKIARFNFLVFIGVVSCLLVLLTHTYIAEKITSLFSGHDASTIVRASILQDGIKMFLAQPVGYGISGFENQMSKIYSFNIYGVKDSHNYFLNVAVNYGLIGISLCFLYISLLIIILVRLINVTGKFLFFILFLSILSFCLASANSSSSFMLTWLIWYMPAMVFMVDNQVLIMSNTLGFKEVSRC